MARERKTMIETGSILAGPDILARVISRDRSQSGRQSPAARLPALVENTQEEGAQEEPVRDRRLEGNNEGNFITSDLPMKITSYGDIKEIANKDSAETNSESTEQLRHVPPKLPAEQSPEQFSRQHFEQSSKPVFKPASKQTSKQSSQQSSQTPAKQSLRQSVLDEGKEHEEKVTKTRLNVDIDEDLHFWLKGHAIQNRRKLNDLIPRILKAYRDQVEEE